MMAKLGATSLKRLGTCDTRLQALIEMVEKDYPRDFTVVCGHRGEEAQEEAFKNGTSKAHFGESSHNSIPSMAVDIAPFATGKIRWGDTESFLLLATHMFRAAQQMGWPIRWGGHFSGGWDKPHFELKGD